MSGAAGAGSEPGASRHINKKGDSVRKKISRLAQKIVSSLASPPARALEVVVALLSLFLAGYVLIAQWDLTGCIADYNDAQSKASAARSKAYERTVAADLVNTDAEDALWNTVATVQNLPPGERQDATEAAFRTFLTARALARAMRADAAAYRAQNPLPEPPSEVCGTALKPWGR